MEILKYPSDALIRVCQPVMHVGDRLREQIAQMIKLMYAGGGFGLAAPQVGLNLRMLVMRRIDDPESQGGEYVLINPVIKNRTHGTTTGVEGCLSLPGEFGKVTRARRVKFTAYRPDGTLIEATWGGLKARVLQHEMDHLDGIMFIDRIRESG